MKVNLYKSNNKDKSCGACKHYQAEAHKEVIFPWGETATGMCECPENGNRHVSAINTVCDDFTKEEVRT